MIEQAFKVVRTINNSSSNGWTRGGLGSMVLGASMAVSELPGKILNAIPGVDFIVPDGIPVVTDTLEFFDGPLFFVGGAAALYGKYREHADGNEATSTA